MTERTGRSAAPAGSGIPRPRHDDDPALRGRASADGHHAEPAHAADEDSGAGHARVVAPRPA
ncbi:hypothetical protein, partial [Pseudonocardia sp. SID8383]